MIKEEPPEPNQPTSIREILSRYFSFTEEPIQHSDHPKKRSTRKNETSTRLKLLMPIPWLLGLLFIFSFYWDFNGVQLSAGEFDLKFDGLLRIISISGLIGFLTNRIAITMLFRPMKKRPLLGQGLIPAHKERIAKRLAVSVADDLINPKLIQKKIEQSGAISKYRNRMVGSINDVVLKPEFRSDLKRWLSSRLHEMINDKSFRERLATGITDEVEQSASDSSIDKAALKAYMFFRGRNIRDIVDAALVKLPSKIEQEFSVVDRYLDRLPEVLDQNIESIDRFAAQLLERLIYQLNVEKIVEENLRSFDENKLEQMIKGASNEQLNTIQYLGAVLGTIGGFVIWEPIISLVMIGTLFGTLYLMDLLLQ